MAESCNLSVLVAVHNSESYLPRLVESLAANRFDGIEYIFVDDGSTDGSLAVLTKLLRDLGIYSISHIEQNVISVGVGGVRQQLLDLARGRYFIYADSDDYVEQGMYEQMMSKAISLDVDMVWEDYFIDGCGSQRRNQQYSESGNSLIAGLLDGGIYGALWNKMFRRSKVFMSGVCFHEDIRCCEDICFLIELLSNKCSVAYLKAVHYHYVQHPFSAVHSNRALQMESIARVDAIISPKVQKMFPRAYETWVKTQKAAALLDPGISDSLYKTYFTKVNNARDANMNIYKRLLIYLCEHGMRHPVLVLKQIYNHSRFAFYES